MTLDNSVLFVARRNIDRQPKKNDCEKNTVIKVEPSQICAMQISKTIYISHIEKIQNAFGLANEATQTENGFRQFCNQQKFHRNLMLLAKVIIFSL
jgi:hypothetical protein